MILDIGNRPVLNLSADKEGEIDKNKRGEIIFLSYIIIIFYNQLTPQILGSLSNLYQTRNFMILFAYFYTRTSLEIKSSKNWIYWCGRLLYKNIVNIVTVLYACIIWTYLAFISLDNFYFATLHMYREKINALTLNKQTKTNYKSQHWPWN